MHLEYLRNMGVTASMSVSLLDRGELWGLIACHHYSGPHRPPYDARAAAEFLGQTPLAAAAGRGSARAASRHVGERPGEPGHPVGRGAGREPAGGLGAHRGAHRAC